MSNKHVFFKLIFSKIDQNFREEPKAEIHARHDGTYEPMTPNMSEAEFDGYIDDLINQLEHIRQEGKRKFLTAKKKLRP